MTDARLKEIMDTLADRSARVIEELMEIQKLLANMTTPMDMAYQVARAAQLVGERKVLKEVFALLLLNTIRP